MVVSVEEVSSSLVREFLSRKGLKRTIACMDEEYPRTDGSINNRSDLRQVLQIEGLYRKNKQSLNPPLKTLLEIIVQSHVEGHGDDDPLRASASAHFNTRTHSHDDADAHNPQYDTGIRDGTKDFHKIRSVMEDSCCPPMLVPERQSSAHDKAVNESVLMNRTNRIRRGILGGPVANLPQDSHKKKLTRRTGLPSSPVPGNEAGPPEQTGLSKKVLASGFPGESTAQGLLRDRPGDMTWSSVESKKSPGRHNTGTDRRPKCSTYSNMDSSHSSEMVLDDFDSNDYEDMPELSNVSLHSSRDVLQHRSYRSWPMDVHTAIEIKAVILGTCSLCFSPEWINQSFSFSDTHDLRYGIVQKKGGPCGVLASVQACVLQKLLFDVPNPGSVDLSLLRPSNAARRRCLVLAAAEVLWRAGGRKTATLVITSGRSHFVPSGFYKSEGFLEKVTCFTADNLNDLQWLLEQHVQQFESGSFGCLLLSISAILSRSIAKVREDMDVSTNTLIGAHGYCTQELVNLLLCGQAVSNVFDDKVELDSGNGSSTLLKGIQHRCDIGLLSLFEHYNIFKVGSHLKTPLFPIWVVCSESHFSTLFGLQRELVTNQHSSQEFDLYYYDGLANQQEEIRLSVSVGLAAAFHGDNDSDLTPPLEHCIRTKWKDAIVNWNDTEPIL